MIDERTVRDLLHGFDAPVPPDLLDRVHRGAQRRRSHKQRLGLIVGAGAAFAVAGTGIAAATGVLPGWSSSKQALSSPFGTAANPGAVPGSEIRLTAPGPESSTFEVVISTVITAAGQQQQCLAIAVKEAGQWQHLITGCRGAGATVPTSASFYWQTPSGATYAIVTGPDPTSDAAKVALQDSNGNTIGTGVVGGGQYLVYASAEDRNAQADLVFYDNSGRVVDQSTIQLAGPSGP
jgi:hypothetical protein